jgi:predicted small integral membrane protein
MEMHETTYVAWTIETVEDVFFSCVKVLIQEFAGDKL